MLAARLMDPGTARARAARAGSGAHHVGVVERSGRLPQPGTPGG